MDSYKSTNSTNPCPICLKTNGNCRNPKAKVVLCMTFADCIGETINGYKNIGLTSDNNWGKFLEHDPEYNIDKQREYQEYKEAKEKARQEQFKGSLLVKERDKAIRAIIKTFGLTYEHRQELKRRDLTDEQIDKGLFCTIKPFSELPSNFTTRLAGVFIGKNGKPTIGSSFQQGILCPIFNQDRLITGYQIMRTEREKDDNSKYVWGATSEKGDRKKISSHLPTGELPINYWFSPEKNNRILWLNDGVLKTYIAHCLHNIDIVGCAGGNFQSSFKQLLAIASDYDYLIYALDAGDVLNRSVMGRLIKVHKLLQENGIELNFAYWGQDDKSKHDIDELEKLAYVSLSLDELKKLANKKQFEAKKRGILDNFTEFTANTVINERYISDYLLKVNVEGQITATNSALNTGKTYYLKQLAKTTNHPIIMIGTRQILTCTSAGQLKIMYADRCLPQGVVEEILESPNDYDRRIAIVVDSLLKLKNANWSEALVVIDEAEQFPEHLLLAKTHINKVRAKVLALLSEKLPEAKGILLFDGHLSDFTCNYFAQMSGLPLQKIKNTFQENYRNLYWYEDKDNLVSLIEESQKDGENLLILGDSAKELTAMFEIDKELGRKSILLTRENIADNPRLSRFLENNGKAIRDDGIKTVYLSPVAQSGVSIEIDNYFDKVYGLINGVIGTNVARQILIRDRSQQDRHIWVSERGLGYTTDYEPEKIKENQEFQEETLLDAIRYFQNKENLNFKEAMAKVYELKITNQHCKDINADARANLIARNNIMKSDYRAILRDELMVDGYRIYDEGDADYRGKLAEVKEKKEEIDIKLANRVYSAPEIDEKEADKLSNKDGLIESERDRLLKYRIQQYLPNFELSPEFILNYILKDRWQSLKELTNLFSARNPEICQKLDANNLSIAVSKALDGGIFWSHDIRNLQTLRQIYELFNIEALINQGSASDDELQAIRDIASQYHNRKLLKLYNIKFSHTTSNYLLARKILELFGYKGSYRKKEKSLKISPIISDEELFNNIYSAITIRMSADFEVTIEPFESIETECPEPSTSNDSEPYHDSPDNIYYNSAFDSYSNPDGARNTDTCKQNGVSLQEDFEITQDNQDIENSENNLDLNIENEVILKDENHWAWIMWKADPEELLSHAKREFERFFDWAVELELPFNLVQEIYVKVTECQT